MQGYGRCNFNPRAPCGARLLELSPSAAYGTFQSTRPVWGATALSGAGKAASTDFNPRAPCGARRRPVLAHRTADTDFNPRAPCGARLCPKWTPGGEPKIFQSTRPVWGATKTRLHPRCPAVHFNPRAPCGARPFHRAGNTSKMPHFNPRAPCGARRARSAARPCSAKNFNPRAPCGARQIRSKLLDGTSQFQSTRPVWGATVVQRHRRVVAAISIHAPRVGRDIVLVGTAYLD